MNACVASFRQRLFIQAAITGIFALLPSNTGNNGWLMITVILAVACAGIAVALPSLGAAAYQTALGFEVVAVLIGGYALTQSTYIPGTIVGIAALIRLLDGSVKAAFVSRLEPDGNGHAGDVRAAVRPPAALRPQYGAPQQFGGQQCRRHRRRTAAAGTAAAGTAAVRAAAAVRPAAAVQPAAAAAVRATLVRPAASADRQLGAADHAPSRLTPGGRG